MGVQGLEQCGSWKASDCYEQGNKALGSLQFDNCWLLKSDLGSLQFDNCWLLKSDSAPLSFSYLSIRHLKKTSNFLTGNGVFSSYCFLLSKHSTKQRNGGSAVRFPAGLQEFSLLH
jgi:hypothetical protein